MVSEVGKSIIPSRPGKAFGGVLRGIPVSNFKAERFPAKRGYVLSSAPPVIGINHLGWQRVVFFSFPSASCLRRRISVRRCPARYPVNLFVLFGVMPEKVIFCSFRQELTREQLRHHFRRRTSLDCSVCFETLNLRGNKL